MFNPNEHMMDLKGKQYLQVMWRLVWFRDEHPEWTITTELLSHDIERQAAVFKASIVCPEGYTVATGHGSESVKDFRDYLEKAETKAIGRALAVLGYGTQFAPDLDETEGNNEPRIVDSPVGFRLNDDMKKTLIMLAEQAGYTEKIFDFTKDWTKEAFDNSVNQLKAKICSNGKQNSTAQH